MGTKKAVITILLVKESVEYSDGVIEEEILRGLDELRIPWMDKVEKVAILASDKKV